MPNPYTEFSVTTSAQGQVATPFNGSTDGPYPTIRFVNPPGSGPYDMSFDGGNTWKVSPETVGQYSEDVPNAIAKVAPASIQVRQNGAAAIAGLKVKLIVG